MQQQSNTAKSKAFCAAVAEFDDTLNLTWRGEPGCDCAKVVEVSAIRALRVGSGSCAG